MNKLAILVLVSLLLLPLLAIGCSSKTTASQTVDITLDEFRAQVSQVKYIEMTNPGTLTIRLGSNPTTGYGWGDAVITHAEVISQQSRNYEAPTVTGMVGAGGTEVWVFNTTDTGLAIISFSYGQSWPGGEKDAFTLTININVR